MAAKRSLHQDPEYEAIPPEIQEKRMKLLEDNVRRQTRKKIESIIKSNFEQEVAAKDSEIDTLDELLYEGRAMLDRLRACIITKYYATLGQEQVPNENLNTSIHPAVKKFLGKSPKFMTGNQQIKAENNSDEVQKSCSENIPPKVSESSSCNNVPIEKYIPKDISKTSAPSQNDDISSRGPRFKTKSKIVIGNISKFIPIWQREESDQSTHKWMVYVRGDKNNPRIEGFVKKVRFLLHPSYRPTDIVEISNPPFHLIKRGWGEFPVRVQLHFHDLRNKPVDIIHNLKLDKTFTGLQTLGAETVVELQLFKPEDSASAGHCYASPVTPEFPSTSKTQDTVSDICSSLISNEPVSKKDINVNMTVEEEPDPLHQKGPCDFKLPIKIKTEPVDGVISSVEKAPESKTENIKNNLCTNMQIIPKRQLLPKLVVPNSSLNNNNITTNNNNNPVFNNITVKNNAVPNGVNTAYVKCTDTEGRVLLVPQSSLLCIRSENSNSKLKTIPNSVNNIASHIKNLSDIRQMNSSATVPSYILKVVPNQDSGQNQVLLIPMAEKKVQCSESSLNIKVKKEITSDNSLDKTPFTSKVESLIKKKKPDFHSQGNIEHIRLKYYKTFVELLRRVCRAFPLVKEGVDRSIFPFCASSLEEFQRWNIGKQRASEWRRAGVVRMAILNLLSKRETVHLKTEDVWSRKEIMTWCRKNGLVPMMSEKMTLLPEPKWSGVELCSLSNANDLVGTLKEENHISGVGSGDEEIDVVETVDNKKLLVNGSTKLPVYHVSAVSEAAVYVKEVASQIGVNIKPIEVEPQVHMPAVEEMILAACRELAFDLIGSAVSEGYNRLGGKLCPEEITVSDVYSAIKKMPQFTFLTNNYLGVPKDLQEET